MIRLHMIPLLFTLTLIVFYISYPVMSAHAKKVIIENITLNVTVIIPVTVVAQNAQICINLASGGNQTCQQINLDSTQTSYTPINVDLTGQTPIITNGSANQTSTLPSSPSNETSSFSGNSNHAFEPGKSNITNPSNDHESNKHDNADSTASDKQKVTEDKDTTNEQDQEESTQDDDNTQNGDTDQP